MSASLETPLPNPAADTARTLRDLGSALPDFSLATMCLLAWVTPEALPLGVVPWILLSMLVEFVVVHSAPFMGLQLVSGQPASRKLRNVVGIGLFYSIFLIGFAFTFHAWWPFATFWALTANRLTVLLFSQAQSGRARETLKASWAAGAICYLTGVGLTTVLPIPRLGLTPEFVRSLHLSGGGQWIEQPWRATAFATFYFAANGFLEATGFALLLPKGAPKH